MRSCRLVRVEFDGKSMVLKVSERAKGDRAADEGLAGAVITNNSVLNIADA